MTRTLRALAAALAAALAFTLAAPAAGALTPEQEMQVARMRLAGVCQRLVMDGLLRTCTVDDLTGKPRKAVRP